MMHRVMHEEAEVERHPKPAVTLRNLPPELVRAIRKRAKDRKTSLTKAAVGLLEEAAGTAETPRARHRYHDLDAFAGRWTREEAAVFEKDLKHQRRIDEEVWE